MLPHYNNNNAAALPQQPIPMYPYNMVHTQQTPSPVVQQSYQPVPQYVSHSTATMSVAQTAPMMTYAPSPTYYIVGDAVCVRNYTNGQYWSVGEVTHVLGWNQYRVRSFFPDASTVDGVYPIQLLDQNAPACHFESVNHIKNFIAKIKQHIDEKKVIETMQLDLQQRVMAKLQRDTRMPTVQQQPAPQPLSVPAQMTQMMPAQAAIPIATPHTHSMMATTAVPVAGAIAPSGMVPAAAVIVPVKPSRFVACQYCRSQKSACDAGQPCRRCRNSNITCVRKVNFKIATPSNSFPATTIGMQSTAAIQVK